MICRLYNEGAHGSLLSHKDPYCPICFPIVPYGSLLSHMDPYWKKKILKNDQKPSKSVKIATLAVRDYARSNRNEKLTLDKSSKYYFDRKNTIL